MFFRAVFGRRAAFLALGLFFFATTLAIAGGKSQPETGLSKADALIQEKNYSEAIRLLAEFARMEPENFDPIQNRLRDIMSLMNNYTAVANILLDMVVDNPENLESILTLSRQLAAMNAARREDTEQFIANIEEVARFTVNRRELERILREGGEQLSQKQYLAALRTYQSGFELYQEQMYRAGYGEEVNSRTMNSLGRIDDFIVSASAMITFFEEQAASVLSLRGGIQDAAALLSTYGGVSPYLDELIQTKDDVTQTMRYFEEQTEVTEAAEVKNEGRFFFPMAAVFIQGRTSEAIREGILGAIDAIWNIAAVPLEQRFMDVAGDYFSRTLDLINREEFNYALSMLETSSNFDKFPLELLEKQTAFDTPDDAAENVLEYTVSSEHIRQFLHFNGLEEINGFLSSACNEGLRYADTRAGATAENIPAAWSAGRISVKAAVSRELELRHDYETYIAAIDVILDELSIEANERFNAVPDSSLDGARTDTTFFTAAENTLRALRDKFSQAVINTASEQYTIANGDLNRELSRLEELLARDRSMLDGVPLKLADGTEITAFYPREAAELSMEINSGLETQIETARQLLDDYQNESGAIAASRSIAELSAEARTITSRISNLQIRNNDIRGLALARVSRAEELLNEGRQLFQTARSALARASFDEAQDLAYRSVSRYEDSLAIQESETLRNEITLSITPLIAEIVQLRYEAVVREVRSLVNNARERYFDGRFDQAEETLVRAEERWASISAEPDSEVAYWLTLTRGALFMRGGRTIPVTAPLYPEMSQLLSGARRNYEEGVRLLNNNRREDGLQMFAAAIQKTQEVRLLFPVNQDAGILELRIEQVRDPAVFNQNFAQRFQSAVNGARRGNVEAFADLQDLAQINPDYPGIRAAVVQAEISMGIRPAPPDPRRLARSNELAAAAQRMFAANVRSQYPLVLENVNEALRLNPNNALAMQVKDRVQVAMGSASAVDSQTEQEYMRAVRELQNGNNLLALSIVQRLLQRPENRDSVRLNELRRRIESSM
ncbi:MAG: hypothetical protein LBH18_07525 [Spirochaetaceae bacterium]|jgi:DNA-directed RNA polymerase subunit F|nr:hypothetical protein [Spirochaetaceae bacterium]